MQRAAERARELALVTGSGAVAFTGPDQRSSASAARTIPTRSSRVDPGDVLASAGDGSAEAEPEGGEHLRERAAAAVEHDAGAHLHHAHAELCARAAPRASQSTQSLARKSLPAGASSSSGSSPWAP